MGFLPASIAFCLGTFFLLNVVIAVVCNEYNAQVERDQEANASFRQSRLNQAFVLLDTATLCLMLVCVAASQLCIYRLADGSYGTIRFSTDDKVDRRDTALGRLVNQYRSEVLLPCSPASLLWPLLLSSRSTFALRPTHCLSSFGLRESRSRSG